MPPEVEHTCEDMGGYLRPGVIIALKAVQPGIASSEVISAYTSIGIKGEVSVLSESVMIGVVYIRGGIKAASGA